MSMYGSGLSYEETLNYEKERIKHAFNNEVMAGEDEDGFIWVPCEKEEAEQEILEIFEDVVFHCLTEMHSARALEKMLEDRIGGSASLAEYRKALEATALPQKYKFEEDEE